MKETSKTELPHHQSKYARKLSNLHITDMKNLNACTWRELDVIKFQTELFERDAERLQLHTRHVLTSGEEVKLQLRGVTRAVGQHERAPVQHQDGRPVQEEHRLLCV